MRLFRFALLISALLVAAITICGCSAGTASVDADAVFQTPGPTVAVAAEPTAPTVRLIVTRDFGAELLFDETIELSPGTSAMEALQETADVETSYGGGFVDAIDGVSSAFTGDHTAKSDWFFSVNGIQSNVGALDYKLQPGDIEQWDFHDWSFRKFIPASIGTFPGPFLNGFRGKINPTIIAPSDSLAKPARQLADRLIELGVPDVRLIDIDEITDTDRGKSNLILIGTIENELISEMNENWKKLGFFARFENGDLIVHGTNGEPEASYDTGTGLIQATQNPWNPNGIGICENVAWMVTGTDASGVESALALLLEKDYPLQYAFAGVITGGEVIRVPR